MRNWRRRVSRWAKPKWVQKSYPGVVCEPFVFTIYRTQLPVRPMQQCYAIVSTMGVSKTPAYPGLSGTLILQKTIPYQDRRWLKNYLSRETGILILLRLQDVVEFASVGVESTVSGRGECCIRRPSTRTGWRRVYMPTV